VFVEGVLLSVKKLLQQQKHLTLKVEEFYTVLKSLTGKVPSLIK